MSSPDDPPSVEDALDPLDRYREKRVAGTPEPAGAPPPVGRVGSHGIFVVHEHHATRTHWDLRLEIDGVLVSWAIPHGPSMAPEDKRLAVKVEAHPLEYCDFEAVIPDGHYGAGPMIVWDRGRFVPKLDPRQGVRDGEVKFELFGFKLRGEFTLVRTSGRGPRGHQTAKGGDDWLLIKKRDLWTDAFAAAGRPLSMVSVLSGLSADELATGAPRLAAWRTQVVATGAPRKVISDVGFAPMLCETAAQPFSSKDWVFELKYDGFRLLGWGGAGQAVLRYRSGHDATARYPELAAVLRALPVPGLVIDGEVCVLDADGKPDFPKLAERAQLGRKRDLAFAAVAAPVVWYAFDLLGADGFDLRGVALERRKALLAQVVPAVGAVRYAEHIPEVGEAFLAVVAGRGLEGVVAKKLGSRYRTGARTRDWMKVKIDPEHEFAVCGFTPPKASRAGLGALHLCVRVDSAWRYAGKVGSGLDDATLLALRRELDTAPRWAPSFPRPEGTGDATWVEPALVVAVRYREWPVDSTLRFPVFLGWRRDRPALACTMPVRHTGELATAAAEPLVDDEPSVRTVQLSNLKKVFWPADGYTKGDLIDYYRSIAPWILPYLVDRPVVITRYPDGIDGKWFYQKDMPDWVPPWLRTMTRWSEHSQREIHYVMVDDADGLAYLANLGSIPIHVWASRLTTIDRPDWTIIDLDPKNAPRAHVVPLALAIHALCESCGLPNYVKTSGQTGLHVLIPLAGQCDFEQARKLAYLLGMVIERRCPEMATTLRNPEQRKGRVYLDWGQNAPGQLLVAPLSVRPVPGAQVSMPLGWHEVVPGLDPGAFTIANARARLEAMIDPVRPVLTEQPDLLGALGRLQAILADAGA